MKMRFYLVAFLAFATGAVAQETPLSPERFEELTEGRTMAHDNAAGVPYGAEIYLPDRQVIWHFLDERACRPGYWYVDGEAICYDYVDDIDSDGPECWVYYKTVNGMRAEHVPTGFVAHLRPPSADEEITCPGYGA